MTSVSSSASVQLRNIYKHYTTIKAVNGVSLDIEGGEFITLLGPSGSGKTTVLKIIAGFIQQTSGELLIDGEIVTAPPHLRNIGMVFQNYALFPHMTALENVAFSLKMRGVPKGTRLERSREALEMVHLGDRLKQYPKQLSGGQQQRVALARALVFQPRVVLMDEPLGALDKKLREFLQLEIRKIQQSLGITMVYVTHDQEEALVMSDRIAVFNHGKIIQIGTAEEIYEKPNSRFVADFIGESNILHGELVSESENIFFSTPIGKFTFASGDLVDLQHSAVVIRPEKLELHPASAEIVSENRIEVVVRDIVYLGSQRKFELEATDGSILIVRRKDAPGVFNPNIGESIILTWSPEDMRGVTINT